MVTTTATGVSVDRQPAHRSRLAAHLVQAWPALVIFAVQRAITIAFVSRSPGGLGALSHRWDAGWYLRLATGGYVYPNILADGRVHNSNLAYFPLFPAMVRWLAGTGLLSPAHALLGVAWVGGLLAAWAIFEVGHAWYGRNAGVALTALWGMAPASLALTMGYPEGWFTAAAAAALWCLIRRRPVWAGIFAAVAGLLRPSAVAVVAMVGVYFVVELVRWWAARRSSAGRDETMWAPGRAFLGVVISGLGLGAFMIYVGLRTGDPFGYVTVQAQWGQRTAGFGEWGTSIVHGLFGADTVSLTSVNLVVCLGYLLLLCLIVSDRRLLWASVYAAGLLLMTLTHVTFQHVYARQLLPAFVLLMPLARLRVPRLGAVLSLIFGSLVMAWGSAVFLAAPSAAL